MIREQIGKLIANMVRKGKYEDFIYMEEFISESINYVQKVLELELAYMTAKYTYEGEDYRQHICELDRQDQKNTMWLIVSKNKLNRLSEQYGIEPIYKGSEERVEVANFAFNVVKELFDTRRR